MTNYSMTINRIGFIFLTNGERVRMYSWEAQHRQIRNSSDLTDPNKQQTNQLLSIDIGDVETFVRWKKTNGQLF